MQDSIRIPPEQWGHSAGCVELPGARSKIGKVGRPSPTVWSVSTICRWHDDSAPMDHSLDCLQGKRQPTALQPSRASLLNAYQTHQNINHASRLALQPVGATRLENDGDCRDMMHGLREIQTQSDHRRGMSSDAKRRAAYLANVLQVRRYFRQLSAHTASPMHSPLAAV